MSVIRFNMKTKDIEIKGSESFIEANFSMIQDLLIANFEIKKLKAARKTEKAEVPVLYIDMVEPELIEEIRTTEDPKAPNEFRANAMVIPSVPETVKEKRLPVRKYILRKANRPANKDQVLDHIKENQEKISIASLRKKLGLNERQIETIIKDAEKEGRIRKDTDGSYVWL